MDLICDLDTRPAASVDELYERVGGPRDEATEKIVAIVRRKCGTPEMKLIDLFRQEFNKYHSGNVPISAEAAFMAHLDGEDLPVAFVRSLLV